MPPPDAIDVTLSAADAIAVPALVRRSSPLTAGAPAPPGTLSGDHMHRAVPTLSADTKAAFLACTGVPHDRHVDKHELHGRGCAPGLGLLFTACALASRDYLRTVRHWEKFSSSPNCLVPALFTL